MQSAKLLLLSLSSLFILSSCSDKAPKPGCFATKSDAQICDLATDLYSMESTLRQKDEEIRALRSEVEKLEKGYRQLDDALIRQQKIANTLSIIAKNQANFTKNIKQNKQSAATTKPKAIKPATYAIIKDTFMIDKKGDKKKLLQKGELFTAKEMLGDFYKVSGTFPDGRWESLQKERYINSRDAAKR